MHSTQPAQLRPPTDTKKRQAALLSVPRLLHDWVERETLARYSRPKTRLLVQQLFSRYANKCLYSASHSVRIHQRLIDTAYSSRVREKVVELLRDCPYFVRTEGYSTGHSRTAAKSYTYQLTNVGLKQNPKHPKAADDLWREAKKENAQHSTVPGVTSAGLDPSSNPDVLPLWVSDCVVVSIDGDSFVSQKTAESKARESLGWNRTRKHIAATISRIEWLFEDDFERDLYLANWIDRKADSKAKLFDEDFDRGKYISELSRNIERAVDATHSDDVQIKGRYGRLYHALNSLPGALRSKLLIQTENGKEHLAEADLSGSFHVILAGSCQCPNMIRDLQSGDYYEKLGIAATEFGYELPVKDDGEIDSGKLKVEIQTHALFNRWNQGFTLHPLWQAFQQLYPKAARRVLYWRRQAYGARRLSQWLSNQEGLLFLEHVIPELERRGIPVISNHDGVLVPESRVEEAKAIIEQYATLQFGFKPVVKTKATRPTLSAAA